MSEAKCNYYDIFLCFRGRDTRYAFTGHLYEALRREGIKTVMDDEHVTPGEQIVPALHEAIEKSMISVIVFSETFADSTSCLDELDKILECRKEENQIVIPIFYKVEPSDVRYQRNRYGEAMTKHESRYGKDSEKVRKWRSSLVEASNLKGYHMKEGRYEYKLIREIVEEASIRVSSNVNNRHIIKREHPPVKELSKSKKLKLTIPHTTSFLRIHGTGGNQMLKCKSEHSSPTTRQPLPAKLNTVFHQATMARHHPAIAMTTINTGFHSLYGSVPFLLFS